MGKQNSNSLIRKLLFKQSDKKQFIFAFLGVFIGFIFVSISIHYLFVLNSNQFSNEVLSSNTMTIQKRVETSHTLHIAQTKFSKQEIEFYKGLPFIERVVLVENNNFAVELQSNDPLIPYFRSDIFIQAIPSSLLDIPTNDWTWKQKDSIVPIVLPRDFVFMMNNFLASSGMPQLSDEILKDVKFRLQIGGYENRISYNAKIIGFSNEISSILVPESFMKYGKIKFGENIESHYTQLMIKAKEKQFGLLKDLIEKNHLEVKKNQLVEGKLKSIVNFLLSVIVLISLVVVLESIIVLVQYIQVLISKNKYEIRTLLRIGVFIKSIVWQYVIVILSGFIVVMILISVSDLFILMKIDNALYTVGFPLPINSNYNIFISLFLMFFVSFIYAVFSIVKFIKNEF